MFNFLKDRATGWQHIEIARLSWFIAAVAALAFTGYVVWIKGAFDIRAFCESFALLNGSGAAGTAAKSFAQGKVSAMGESK